MHVYKLTKQSKQCGIDRKRKSVLFSRTPYSIKVSVRITSPHTLISVTMCNRPHCYKPMPENIFNVPTTVNIQIMVYLVWLLKYQHFRVTCCPHLQRSWKRRQQFLQYVSTSLLNNMSSLHRRPWSICWTSNSMFPTLCYRNLFIMGGGGTRPIKIKDQVSLNMFM